MRVQVLNLFAWLGILAPSALIAQEAAPVALPAAVYDQLKQQGQLPAGAIPMYAATEMVARPIEGDDGTPKGGGGGSDHCGCWIEPDASYSTLPKFDDGSSSVINLPFQFNLYGDLYNSVYVNNNGNISFVQAFGTYSATGFPNNTHRMVAPFWADVDTRGNGGDVRYKVTPTAMYVNWVGVGYFNQQTDKRNWFQLIITNGDDPVIGIGKNVSFCYKDMQWTTGSASGGINGFWGTPATVGANRGLGSGDYIQFGRFDHAGTDYDGPFGENDGVSWLDNKNFVFTTAVSTQNIPPIASSLFLCDTIQVCVGEQMTIQMDFIAPEPDQVTVATSLAPTLSNYTEVTNTSGITATIISQFAPIAGEEGFHTITYSGTDNGAPALTSTVDIVVQVVPGPPVPEITGPNLVCAGDQVVLTANPPGAGTFNWSNNTSGPTITVGPGTYTVSMSQGGCAVTSAPFTVALAPDPAIPQITGPTSTCADPVLLTVEGEYTTYLWSTGSTEQTTMAGAGSHTVTVTNDHGCEATSAPFVVEHIPFVYPVITGDTLACEGNTVTLATTAPFDNYVWSTGETTNTIELGPEPGVHTVTVDVTTNAGCHGTAPAVTVTISPAPTASFISNPTSPQPPGTEVTFTDLSNGNGYALTAWDWTVTGPESFTAFTQDVVHLFPTPGNYSVLLTVTNEHGCTASFQTGYLIRPDSVQVPNVFTPNGDGVNDMLVFENAQYYRNHLKVFNRWGQMVLDRPNYQNNWRATDMPEGTYFFVLYLYDTEQEISGHVTILRGDSQ